MDNRPQEVTASELEKFAYIVSHDFQAPIRAILGFSQLLREDLGTGLSKDADSNIRHLEEAASRLKVLVHGVLAYSRSTTAELKGEWLSLRTCAMGALEQLNRKADACGAKVEADEMPEVYVDPRLMTIVYNHLLDNALTYHDSATKPVIRLTAERVDRGWIFGVLDNGIGIAERNRERVFSPLKRLHPPTRYPGAGVGLTICKKLIERHNGRIWVEENPEGKGCHVRFMLGTTGCMKGAESARSQLHDHRVA